MTLTLLSRILSPSVFIGIFYFISIEEQVISRAHRMGANRPIHVETLAMRGTIEEQMVEFLQVCFFIMINLKREN